MLLFFKNILFFSRFAKIIFFYEKGNCLERKVEEQIMMKLNSKLFTLSHFLIIFVENFVQ